MLKSGHKFSMYKFSKQRECMYIHRTGKAPMSVCQGNPETLVLKILYIYYLLFNNILHVYLWVMILRPASN